MPSAARYAAVDVVGRSLPHVVRDALCEGDEGIAEVLEQHRYPPSASAVRECDGNVVSVQAVSLEIMQIVTSTIRAIYLHCVCVVGGGVCVVVVVCVCGGGLCVWWWGLCVLWCCVWFGVWCVWCGGHGSYLYQACLEHL